MIISEERELHVFELRILRRINGPTLEEGFGEHRRVDELARLH